MTETWRASFSFCVHLYTCRSTLLSHSVQSLDGSSLLETRLHLRDSSEVARALNQRCYPHTGNCGHRWCLSSSPSLSVGLSIQNDAMYVARSAPQGAQYHADVIYLFPQLRIKKGARALWYSYLCLRQLGSRPTAFILRWTTHPCILYQVCATRAVNAVVP